MQMAIPPFFASELGREIEVVDDPSRKTIREIGHSAEDPDGQRKRSAGYLEYKRQILRHLEARGRK